MAKSIKIIQSPKLPQRLTAELLGQAIQAKRTQSNLRLTDAAALCGVSKQTLMNIEKGRETTQLNTLLQICASLGIILNIQPWSTNNEDADEWR